MQPTTAPFRARSNLPFYVGLIILSGLYVLLITGMLLAEGLFLYPPNSLVLLVAKENPKNIAVLDDLRREDLRIGLGNLRDSELGRKTRKLFELAWLDKDVLQSKREVPIIYKDEGRELVSSVNLGLIDVAVVSEEALNSGYLALVVANGNPKNIRSAVDLSRGDIKVGLGDPDKSDFGRRSKEHLQSAGTWRDVTKAGRQCPLLYSDSQETLVEKIKSGEIDVALVAPRDVTVDPKHVEPARRWQKIIIDVRRYSGHVSPLWYPLWWLRIKLWALVEPLTRPEIRYALKLSLISCTITTILSLWVAVPFGYLMSRFTFPGKTLIDAILDIPIVLPPLVIGLALLILFQTPPGRWFEDNVVGVTFAIPSVILAQFAVACAFAVRTMRVSFDQISIRQEQVALTLGCSRGQAFWKVVLPEARRGMVTAGTLAWARALGEFGPILVFSGATRMRTEVLPTTVFLELSVGNIETAVAVSLLMVLAAVIVLVIVRVFGMEKTPLQVK